MCGIFAVIGNKNSKSYHELRNKFLTCSKLLRHRGPDWNGIYINDEHKAVVCHERLSIVDVDNGAQPLYSDKLVLSVNGEIYNHKGIKNVVLQGRHEFSTESDCEPILYLYKEYGINFLNMLDGVFCFMLYDSETNNFLVARDPIGVNPLYYGVNNIGEYCFASEFKSIREWDSECEITMFPPGHYMTGDFECIRYYNPKWLQYDQLKVNYELGFDGMVKRVRDSLIQATEKRLMADVPFGTLLSGGLDSSLTTSIASRLLKESPEKGVWGDNLHTFSVGLKGSPDLRYAKEVAEFLGTVHHEFTFTIQEGIDALRDVIYHLETYDVTTIRASTPMYLMSRKIKATGIKMVLSGEGADEILGGYLYFHNAPTEEEFHKEVIKRVSGLHYFDCLRANKSTMAWGLEVRVPFLDKQFLETSIPIRKDYKMNKITENGKNIEKYILRKAFSKELNDGYQYLPDSVLWRQKEQFSDGVGYSWVDTLIQTTEDKYSDDEFTNLIQKYPYNTPMNKEALFYREIFEELFPKCEKTVEKWIPNTQWEGVKSDPSGRAQGVHSECDSNMV